MDSSTSKMPTTSLFQVYLRLRPPMPQNAAKPPQDPWLIVEEPASSGSDADDDDDNDDGNFTKHFSTHITLQPPNESRKRAIERFGFTKVLHEEATQLDVFEETGIVDGVRGVLQNGRDGLIATLGVTGSGKSHTILGTKSQRGLTQMSLDVLFRSIGSNIRRPTHPDLPVDMQLLDSLKASDPSDAQIIPAATFLENVYADGDRARYSRAQTPMAPYGSRAGTPMMDFPQLHHARKMPMPRPSAFAQEPDMSEYTLQVDSSCDYVVLVSMYEVYNDRIFDLLSNIGSSSAPPMTTRAGATLQKGLLRRPLLFKNTEQSPDGKVVAGLKKIVCSSYDEAMMILETGLTERRVAGTGSNSVSSRSHGFFCIEVKKRYKGNDYAGGQAWSGGALSIVDLAGSERARNAKTTGSTLAEAGKINESLMYLGQCLQVQSDCQQDGTKPIVPFRQCKLTELLFSNSFPTGKDAYRPPQKAVMIVTADAQGDFNATSQILRYSALAREVTVPRIPSITNTMNLHINLKVPSAAAASTTGRLTPMAELPSQSATSTQSTSYFTTQELDQAHHEITRLAEECNNLSIRLAEEEIKRTEAELKLQAADDRALVAEQEIREECWSEMEAMLQEERRRWKAAWEEERFNGQEYLDEKIDILDRAGQFKIHEDVDTSRDELEQLERENATLKLKLAKLEQETQLKSPSKKSRTIPKTPQAKNSANTLAPPKMVLGDITTEINKAALNSNLLADTLKGSSNDDVFTPKLIPGSFAASTQSAEDDTRVSEVSPRKLSLRNSTMRTSIRSEASLPAVAEGTPSASPGKKMRKLTARKWDLGDGEDLF